MKEEERKRIERQRAYDKENYIKGVTIDEWKQGIKERLFVINRTWKKDEEGKDYCTEEMGIDSTNYGIAKEVKKQKITYSEIMEEEDLNGVLYEIILKAISKYEIEKDCRPGEEENKLFAYVLVCLKHEIKNYINEYTSSIRDRSNGQDKVLSPDLLLSLDAELSEEEEEGERFTLNDVSAESQNITYQHNDYIKSDTYNLILESIEDDLTQEQQDILHLLSTTTISSDIPGNDRKVGLMLKEIDIELGRKTRASDEAYRVAVLRERAKISNIINEKIDLHSIRELVELRERKEEIEKLVESEELNEKKVIDYIVGNLERHYIDKIVYELDIETRRFLIINYINDYNEEKLNHKETRKLCRYILSKLYKYIDELDNKIKELSILRGIETDPKPIEKRKKDRNIYKYYVLKDKFEELAEIKNIEKVSEEMLIVEHTRIDEPYQKYTLDTFYLGQYEESRKRATKTEYGKINLLGHRYIN